METLQYGEQEKKAGPIAPVFHSPFSNRNNTAGVYKRSDGNLSTGNSAVEITWVIARANYLYGLGIGNVYREW